MSRLVFIIVILLISTFLVNGSTNLMYILKSEKNQIHPSCIAEELERYKAIGWIYPLVNSKAEELAIPKTKYMPNIQNDYNCKFSTSDKCNLRWMLKNWQIDDSSSKTREFLGDSRWDDLPTIILSKEVKEFEKRFLIEVAHKIGFSVRSSGPVEVFLCSGWNPYSYPCYYFHISKFEIYFSKFHTFDNTTMYTKSPHSIKHYKSSSKIISEDEWRNFEVSVDQDGKVTLMDKNLNRVTIEYIDNDDSLTPMYLLIRSTNISAWKISENQFMFTKTAQISRMGPQLQTPFKDLCISLFVATCTNCEMTFFYISGSNRIILKRVEPTNENWMEIKLKQENMPLSKFNLFVESKFINNGEQTEGWWAYDDVRICHENEVKITYLNLKPEIENNPEAVDNISCQLISKPSWRPRRLDYDEIKGFPHINVAPYDTSIKLTWSQEDPDNLMTYFLLYEGTDYCNTDINNSVRLRSAGFLSSKHSEFTITNLIPNTRYNITISTILHRIDKFLVIDTLESEEPYFDELPVKMQLRPTDTTVNVSWDKPTCNAQRGRLLYTIKLSSPVYNISKTVEYHSDNTYIFTDLRPFTLYTVQIWTARNARMLNTENKNTVLQYRFTTLAGVAPSIRKAEVYATGSNTIYIRYQLPLNATGIPTDIQVSRCKLKSFAKCRSAVSKIIRCPLWKKMYCVQVDNLLENSSYKFSLSIKNNNSSNFGEAINLTDYAIEKVPAPPESVTYKIEDCKINTDYCNLKINWRYPYYPNGTINVFYILLENIETNSTEKPILEIYKISNDTLFPTYTYEVQNITFNTKYKLLLQSANSLYRSKFTAVEIQTEPVTKYLNQKPILLVNNESALVFKLPTLDHRLDSSKITVIIQDFNTSTPLQLEFADKRIVKKLCHPFGLTWISQVIEVINNQTKNITIKTLDGEHILHPNTQYCVTFVVRNQYNEKEYDVFYYEKLVTANATLIDVSTTDSPKLSQTSQSPPVSPPETASSGSYNHLYILLAILLLIPIGFIIYRLIRKRKTNRRRQEQQKENVYESVPFDEQYNGLYNKNYDQLIHK